MDRRSSLESLRKSKLRAKFNSSKTSSFASLFHTEFPLSSFYSSNLALPLKKLSLPIKSIMNSPSRSNLTPRNQTKLPLALKPQNTERIPSLQSSRAISLLSKRRIKPFAFSELQAYGEAKPSENMPAPYSESQAAVLGGSIYLFGGRIRKSHTNSLNLSSFTWNSYAHDTSRVGHSLVTYKDNLVLYGGETLTKKYSEQYMVYNADTGVWAEENSYGNIPLPRKHHAATQVGKHMLVFGGVFSNSARSSEFLLLDLQQSSWINSEIATPGAFSSATLTPVLDIALKRNSNFSFFYLAEAKCFYKFQNSGVYLFGGVDSTGRASNSLHRVTGNNGAIIWEQIKATGKLPIPRYGHSAVSVNSNLFVYGGRNDSKEYLDRLNGLNDLHILNVITWEWSEVRLLGLVPRARWGHFMCEYQSGVLVLGGQLKGEVLPWDVYYLETDGKNIGALRQKDDNVKATNLLVTTKLTSVFKAKLHELLNNDKAN